jgi:hypothetical protein
LIGIDIMNSDRLGFEDELLSGLKPCRDQVFNYFGLTINSDGPAARELEQIDSVPARVKTQLDATVNQSFALQPVGETGVLENVDGALLEDSGSDAALDVLATALFDND